MTPGTATTNPANAPGAYTFLSSPSIANTNGFTSYFYCHTQCGYDDFVRVDPRRPDVVYLGGSMNYDGSSARKRSPPGAPTGAPWCARRTPACRSPT